MCINCWNAWTVYSIRDNSYRTYCIGCGQLVEVLKPGISTALAPSCKCTAKVYKI